MELGAVTNKKTLLLGTGGNWVYKREKEPKLGETGIKNRKWDRTRAIIHACFPLSMGQLQG